MYRRQNHPTRRSQLGYLLIGNRRALLGKPWSYMDWFRASEPGGAWEADDPAALLVRRNLLTYTEDLSNAVWTKAETTISANAVAAPDGTITADALLETAATAQHRLMQTRAVISGSSYTLSAYLKDNGRRYALLYFGSAAFALGPAAYVDLQTGTITSSGGGAVSTSISDQGGGWYRVALTAVATASVTSEQYVYLCAAADSASAYAGDITKSIYLWGAQLELGSTATDYQRVATDWNTEYLAAVGSRVTAYQDSAGTTAGYAPGQGSVDPPVGLLLDKRLGLVRGAELVVNGDGSTTTGWTAGVGTTLSVVSGAIKAANAGTDGAAFGQNLGAFTAGQTIEIYFDSVSDGTSKAVQIYLGTSLGSNDIATGPAAAHGTQRRFSYTFTANRAACWLWFYPGFFGVANYILVDNISVRELPGNHLVQATAASRMVLSQRYNILAATATMSTQNATTLAASYKLSFTGTGSVTLSGTSTAGPLVGTGADDRVSLTFTPTAGTLTLTVSGSVTLADLRTSADAALNIPTYQAIVDASNYTTAGFPLTWRADGGDDSAASTTGGGASTAALIMLGFTVGAAGAAQTLWSDRTGNTGLKLEISAGNAITFSGGNGASINTVTGNAVTLGQTYIVTALYEGGVLSVQLNDAAPVTGACVLSAGTAGFTVAKDNGTASGYFKGRLGSIFYRKDSPVTASSIARAKRYIANQLKVTI